MGWKDQVQKSVKDSSNDIETLEGDIGARFNGLNAVVQSLGDQVKTLSAYSMSVPETRVAYAQASNWATAQGWGTKVTTTLQVPSYPCSVNVYAAAHAYVWSQKAPDGTTDQFANGQSRINIQGISLGPAVFGAIHGPDGNERWALGVTHSAAFSSAGGGTLSILYDVYNSNTYNSSGTDAGLAVIATFTRVM